MAKPQYSVKKHRARAHKRRIAAAMPLAGREERGDSRSSCGGDVVVGNAKVIQRLSVPQVEAVVKGGVTYARRLPGSAGHRQRPARGLGRAPRRFSPKARFKDPCIQQRGETEA